MIPTEDFTDMTLVSEDTEAHDYYDGPGVLHEEYVAQFQTNLSWVWHHNLGGIVDCSFGGGAMSFVRIEFRASTITNCPPNYRSFPTNCYFVVFIFNS